MLSALPPQPLPLSPHLLFLIRAVLAHPLFTLSPNQKHHHQLDLHSPRVIASAAQDNPQFIWMISDQWTKFHSHRPNRKSPGNLSPSNLWISQVSSMHIVYRSRFLLVSCEIAGISFVINHHNLIITRDTSADFVNVLTVQFFRRLSIVRDEYLKLRVGYLPWTALKMLPNDHASLTISALFSCERSVRTKMWRRRQMPDTVHLVDWFSIVNQQEWATPTTDDARNINPYVHWHLCLIGVLDTRVI